MENYSPTHQVDYVDLLNAFEYQNAEGSMSRSQSFTAEEASQTFSNAAFVARADTAYLNEGNTKAGESLPILSSEQHYDAGLLMLQASMKAQEQNMSTQMQVPSAMPWLNQNAIIDSNRYYGGFLPIPADRLESQDPQETIFLGGLTYDENLPQRTLSDSSTRTRYSRKNSRASVGNIGTVVHSTKPKSKRTSFTSTKSRHSSEDKTDSENENNEDDAEKRQRGRPRLDAKDETAVDRRRTQIRLAQRAYRQRKETTISSLKVRAQELEEALNTMSTYYFDLRDIISAGNAEEDALSLTQTIDNVTEKVNALKSKIAAGSLSIEDTGIDDRMDMDRSRKRKKSADGGLLNNVIGESSSNNDSMTTQTQTQDIDLGWFERFSLTAASPIYEDSTHVEGQLPTPPFTRHHSDKTPSPKT